MLHRSKTIEPSWMPAEFEAVSDPSPVLLGEDVETYQQIKQMIIDDIVPQTNIEWFWTLDLVELSWEILRYRRLKQKVLDMHRENAIQSILQRIDGAGLPSEATRKLLAHTKRNAEEWREDRGAANEIEARLARHGFDAVAVTAEVFIQAQAVFDMFDRLMHTAQGRRLTLIREINIRREFAGRVKNLRSVG